MNGDATGSDSGSSGGGSGGGSAGGSDRVLVSYLTLRKIIGLLGVSLPILVAVGCIIFGACTGILESISVYYGTAMRDVFVGILFTVAWFLFAYRGYERKDDLAGDVACVCAIAVAIFPVTSGSGIVRIVHFVAAAGLLLTFAYFSIYLFTKSGGSPTPEKLLRNKVYRACGGVIVVSVALIPVAKVFAEGTAIESLQPVFWLETFALWAFGLSWITKGEWILADG